MAKDRERQAAYYHYVEKGCSAKETAIIVQVAEATVGEWVRKLGWRRQRDARAMFTGVRTDNMRQLLDDLAAQHIELGRELDLATAEQDKDHVVELRKQLASVDKDITQWQKTLTSADKDGKVSLSVYLEVMEQIFNALRVYDEKLYLKVIEFQQQHIHDMSIRLCDR